MSKKVRRLFEQFQPEHYEVDLIPDRDALTFTGSVTIVGKKVGRPSQRITLHQKDLKITRASIIKHEKNGDTEVDITRINTHVGFDEVRLHTGKPTHAGKYTVRLEFSGKITRAMDGIYPCFFKEGKTEKRLIATQFESHFARQVFPCIDEPEAKATFDLILTTPKDEVAIANTPIKAQEVSGSSVRTAFETTPKMSTYLLAFVYGEMKYKESKTKQGVVIRVYSTPENIDRTDFALETAVQCLEFYNDYFGVDYPLPKCDFIALPDFAAGAMENWGCITFREQALLVDEKRTSLMAKQYVAHVIAHELTHQWFGNLVTMRWWTDLWLNEGFATWMSYLAIDHMFPEWQMWTQFIVDEQQQAMKLDALVNTHPIEVTVGHPDEIRTIFDSISYDKGASVIHMLHDYLGARDFRVGLSYYLKQHSYANTDTDDLWEALETASEKPVKEFMHAWTSQPGFPVVHADIDDKAVSLSQERFFINPLHRHDSVQRWPVPLHPNIKGITGNLEKANKKFEAGDQHELKLNAGQGGFYRTVYNSTHLEKLSEQLRRGKFGPLDRLGLLGDALEGAKAGKLDTLDVLRFLQNFQHEDNYAVWDVIASCFGSIRMVMDDDELRKDMKPFVRGLVASELKRLGWERKKTDTHFDRLLRPVILGMAAAADEPSVVKKCKELFAQAHSSQDISPDLKVAPLRRNVRRGGDIDPDLRGMVFGTIARIGDKKEFDLLLAMHNATALSEERVTLTAALTGFRQPALVKRALQLVTSDEVRLQDASYWIAYSFLNRFAREEAWKWLKENWDWLKENLGSDHSFSYMPIYAARAFSREDFITEYRDFFTEVMEPVLERSYKQGIEMIEWQSAWRQRDLKEIKHFFAIQAKS